MTTTLNERIARMQTLHIENRIIRGAWHEGERTSDGYERACILAAFSPEAAEREDADACPADAMPRWLANLTPYLDDRVSEKAWPRVLGRYVAVLPQLVRLPADRLVRLDFETRAVAVREARRHTRAPKVLEAIDGALVLLDAAALGREVTIEESAAQAAQAAQATTEASVVWVKTWAKTAKAKSAEAAFAAAEAASAAWTTALKTAKAAAWAAKEAEGCREAAWDRMADAMLTAWETAV